MRGQNGNNRERGYFVQVKELLLQVFQPMIGIAAIFASFRRGPITYRSRVPAQEAPTPLMDGIFLRTAATRQVTAGAAEFGSAEIRCSSFDGIFIETKSTDQRQY